MKIKLMILSLILCFLPFNLLAAKKDTESSDVPAHTCKEPKKPRTFNRQAIETYKKNIDVYRNCIVEYVKEHNEEAKKYQKLAEDNRNAANQALDDWNRFVNEELSRQQKEEKDE